MKHGIRPEQYDDYKSMHPELFQASRGFKAATEALGHNRTEIYTSNRLCFSLREMIEACRRKLPEKRKGVDVSSQFIRATKDILEWFQTTDRLSDIFSAAQMVDSLFTWSIEDSAFEKMKASIWSSLAPKTIVNKLNDFIRFLKVVKTHFVKALGEGSRHMIKSLLSKVREFMSTTRKNCKKVKKDVLNLDDVAMFVASPQLDSVLSLLESEDYESKFRSLRPEEKKRFFNSAGRNLALLLFLSHGGRSQTICFLKIKEILETPEPEASGLYYTKSVDPNCIFKNRFFWIFIMNVYFYMLLRRFALLRLGYDMADYNGYLFRTAISKKQLSSKSVSEYIRRAWQETEVQRQKIYPLMIRRACETHKSVLRNGILRNQISNFLGHKLSTAEREYNCSEKIMCRCKIEQFEKAQSSMSDSEIRRGNKAASLALYNIFFQGTYFHNRKLVLRDESGSVQEIRNTVWEIEHIKERYVYGRGDESDQSETEAMETDEIDN